MTEQVELQLARQMALITAQIHNGAGLPDTLQAVSDGVVEILGFTTAAVNLVDPDGDLTVMAVTGSVQARAAILGQRLPRSFIDGLLDRAEAWGALAFIPHQLRQPGAVGVWSADGPDDVGDGLWHRHNALLAPLRTPESILVGLLSVDLDHGSPFPTLVTCELLQAFATSAAVAIDRAKLVDALQTEREQLQASERAFRFAFSFSAGPMATFSLAAGRLGRFEEANDAFCGMLRLKRSDLDDRSWFDFVAAEDLDDSRDNFVEFAAGRLLTNTGERQLVRSDGSLVWVSLTASAIVTAPNSPPFLLVHLHDLTARRSRELTLLRESTQDPLTGLANRRALYRHLDTALHAYRSGGPGGVVIFGDLNRFKRVNDRYGHAAGDAVLRRVAQRLLLLVRTTDLVARPSGDEFVVVAADLTLDEGRHLADRIRADLAGEQHAFGEAVTISLGVTDFDAASDADALVDRADLAMYTDKGHRGR